MQCNCKKNETWTTKNEIRDSDDTGRKRPGFSEEGIHHIEGVKTKNDQMVSLLNGKVLV